MKLTDLERVNEMTLRCVCGTEGLELIVSQPMSLRFMEYFYPELMAELHTLCGECLQGLVHQLYAEKQGWA